MNTKKSNIVRLTESAIMLALSAVLSMMTINRLPFGGSVTPCSQLPLVIISYRYGAKWGCFTGLCAGLIQMLLGFNNFSYVTGLWAVLVLIFSDYVLPFSFLGLGGIFRSKIKNQAAALAVGAVFVSLLRFACHFVSGVTIWSGYAQGVAVPLYSLTYNGSYMLPEAIITAVSGALISLPLDFTQKNIVARKRK